MRGPAHVRESSDPSDASVDAFQPRRDDDVAAWLRRHREVHPPHSERYWAIEGLLDRYRECAACGLSLRPEDDEKGMP